MSFAGKSKEQGDFQLQHNPESLRLDSEKKLASKHMLSLRNLTLLNTDCWQYMMHMLELYFAGKSRMLIIEIYDQPARRSTSVPLNDKKKITAS